MLFLERVRAALHLGAPLARRADGAPIEPEVLAATGALLVAAACGDHEFAPAEHRAIEKSLRGAFGISRAQAMALLEEAEATSEPEPDLARTAAAVAASFDPGQRQRVLGLVWTVVYADRVVDDAEVALAEQVAALLGLTEAQSLEAREKAFQWFSTTRSEP